MPAKISWIVLFALMVGGAYWFLAENRDISIPVALPLFLIAFVAITPFRRTLAKA